MIFSQDVKERPILLGGAWVRAILAGRKTQTRRPARPQPPAGRSITPCAWSGTEWAFGDDPHVVDPAGCSCYPVRCPYGEPGDRLWVRETWAISGHYRDGPRYEYRAFPADGEHFRSVGAWKPSIHMPREACRLVLEITDVRAERLQDMTEADAVAEGVADRAEFAAAWDATYPYACLWAWNPWVWAITFKQVKP